MASSPIPFKPDGGKIKAIRGQILTFKADPFLHNENECYDYLADGLVVIQDGVIIDAGNYAEVSPRYPQLEQSDIDTYVNSLIVPGFIDCHVHYVQSPMIGSFGDTLLSWLEEYTYPTESL